MCKIDELIDPCVILDDMPGLGLRDDTMDRMVRAVELVHERLIRATRALRDAGIEYAVAGGNAVAAWVAQVDEGAVRNTRDVNILIRRIDFPRVQRALEQSGFSYQHAGEIDVFLDGPNSSAREGVHLIFAGELVRPSESAANPEVTDSVSSKDFQVLSLDALVRIKLMAFRRKDQVHLLDMIDLGMLDPTWYPRLPPELADRLKTLMENPD